MNNIESFNQDNQKSYFKSVIKPLLLVIFGIILGAGVVSMVWFFCQESEEGAGREEGISEETQAEVVRNFKEDLEKNFSTVFGKDSVIDVYIMEKGEDMIGVCTTISPSDEQFKTLFGIDLEELNSEELEQLRGVVIIAQAEYVNRKGEWILKGEPKIYQGIDLVLMQESLGTAREKAKDAAIKADLSMMRAAAEMWAMDHDDSYDGFCTSPDAKRAMADIAKNGKIALCDDTVATWAAFSSLYDATAQCYCVDYWGTFKALNSPCPKAAVTVCP